MAIGVVFAVVFVALLIATCFRRFWGRQLLLAWAVLYVVFGVLMIFSTNPFGTAPTGTASCLWQQELPQTTGSSWEEFPPAGYEYCLNLRNAVGGLALWVTNSVATSTPLTNVWR